MKTPILASLYRLFGFLGFIAGGLSIVLTLFHGDDMPGGVMFGIIAIFSGIISIGIAEVITLIAKIEYNTASSAGSGSDKIQKEISATLKALLQASKATTDLPPVPGSERYFVAIEGSVDGPYRLSDIKELRSKGALDDSALFIQERGQEWKSISEIK